MADDRIDWAYVAAVGMVARDWFDDFREENCVRALLAHESHAFCKGLSVYQPNVDRIASALREAHEAGLREEVADLEDRLDFSDNGWNKALEERDAARDELRALRRELAARRALGLEVEE